MYRSVALLFLSSILVISSANLVKEKVPPTDGLRLVCYYSNWAVYRPGLAKFTPQNINPYLCTHLIYAFATLSSEFEIAPLDPYNDIEQGNYKAFVSLKAYNPNLKTMIAVGGWDEGSKKFSKLVESDYLRQRFVKSAIAFVREYSFDGLDMDWEYPAFREGGNDTDKIGYAKLIKELRYAIEEERVPPGKERLLLTVAVPATQTYIDMGFDVPTISKNADFLNLLTYDYHSAYEPETHHHAPLFHSKALDFAEEDKTLNVEWTVNYYLQLGCPKEKIVVGIPMYGRSYTLSKPAVSTNFLARAIGPGDEGHATREKGYLAYYEVCQRVKDDDWEVEAPYSESMGPYAYKGDQWVGFDDEEMISIKVRFILDRGLGGAMVWTLDNDDFRGICTDEQSPLVNTLRTALLFSNVIEGSPSRQSLARSAGPQSSSTILFDDDDPAKTAVDPAAGAPRRRNTLRRLVQDRQTSRRNRNERPTGRRVQDEKKENVFTTPAPPPTPDPGFAFECKDEGFFNNPRDCKKYFWCLDSGPANLGVVAHAFTCPSGLFFNAATESCDYPENVVCPIRSSSVTKAPASRVARPRGRTTTTTTTTTTTLAPTTAAEDIEEYEDEEDEEKGDVTPADSSSSGGENVAELLRLLQAIGGVEKLQSLLGSQIQTTGKPEILPQTLPGYVTPKRSTLSEPAPPVTSHPLPSNEAALRPQKQQQPDHRQPQRIPEFDTNVGEDSDKRDFPFRYQTPTRGRDMEPGVEYMDEGPDELDEDDEPKVSSPDAFSYGTPPLRSTQGSPTESPVTEDRLPRQGGPGYRAPIKVQVVRRPNGGAAGEAPGGGGGVRRRMRVRVRADGGRVVEEAPRAPQARAIAREEHKSAAAARTVLVRDPNPPIFNNPNDGEPRVAVRRQPVFHPNNNPNNVAEIANAQGANVRFIARSRRPNADALVNQVNGQVNKVRPDANFVAVRRVPAAASTRPQAQEPQRVAPQNPSNPGRSVGLPVRPGYQPPIDQTSVSPPPPRRIFETTTKFITTTTTTAQPKIEEAVEPHDLEYEYDDEYEDYLEEEEEATTSTTPSTTTTRTTTTTTTKAPPAATTRRSLIPRRRLTGGTTPTTTTTTQRPTASTSSSRRSTASSSRQRGTSAATTTRAPPAPKVTEAGVVVKSDSDVDCLKRGVFIHPTDCSKFIVCAPSSRSAQGLRGRVLLCPANQIYLEDIGRCMKGDRKTCVKL